MAGTFSLSEPTIDPPPPRLVSGLCHQSLLVWGARTSPIPIPPGNNLFLKTQTIAYTQKCQQAHLLRL